MSDLLAPPPDAVDLDRRLEEHRSALVAHCARMLGPAEAEDAVQETIVRAWRSYDRFEGRASLRSWLYRIATNVCLDMGSAKQRRARPVDLAPGDDGDRTETLGRHEPVGSARPPEGTDDPAEQAVARERVRQAFLAALVHLPPRQRSVLILRDVLRWQATEVAELLGTTVASTNSALQRARSTMAGQGADRAHRAGGPAGGPVDADRRAQVQRYADAFERCDLDSLVSLLS